MTPRHHRNGDVEDDEPDPVLVACCGNCGERDLLRFGWVLTCRACGLIMRDPDMDGMP